MARESSKTETETRSPTLSVEFSSVSSDKLFTIFEFLSRQTNPIRLQDLAKGLSMSQPTVLRYLNSLVKMGYIYKDAETLRYTPTFKICRISHRILTNITIRDVAWPDMRALSLQIGCGATVAKPQNNEILYLDVIYHPSAPFGSLQRIGKGAPMHVTGSGKLFLSALSDENLSSYIQKYGLPCITDKSITSTDQFRSEIEKIREQGYSIDDEECEIGFRCISAPLYDYTDELVAAASLFAPVSIFNLDFLQNEVAPRLKKVARYISFRLGAAVSVDDNMQ